MAGERVVLVPAGLRSPDSAPPSFTTVLGGSILALFGGILLFSIIAGDETPRRRSTVKNEDDWLS